LHERIGSASRSGDALEPRLKRDLDVTVIRFILIGLICATPAMLLADGPIIHGLVAASTAVAVLSLAWMIRPGEADFLLSILRPIAVIAAIPAIWIVVQILPLPAIGLAHPIWGSAAAALGHPLSRSISIDTGASLLALARYLSTFAIFVVSMAVAIDRQRANWILFALMFATASIALIVISHDWLGLNFLLYGAGSPGKAEAIDCAALGVIISATVVLRAFELQQTGETNRDYAAAAPWQSLVPSVIGLAICLAALAMTMMISATLAAAFGVATMMAVAAIRYFNLGSWGVSGIVAVAAVVGIALIASHPQIQTNDLTLAFATQAATPLASITQHILADNPWTGLGAGNFAAIAPVYRGIDDNSVYIVGSTAAATTVIELGRWMLLGIVGAVIIAIIALLRGALRRGRDWFYAACGASCLITLLALAFSNAGLFGTAISIIAAAAFGLAFAQSKSRTAPQPIPLAVQEWSSIAARTSATNVDGNTDLFWNN
jgi:hypothetical protein